MRRLEKREIMATYCDWCNKDLTKTSGYVILCQGDKEDKHLCNTYNSKIEKTCYDKHNESLKI